MGKRFDFAVSLHPEHISAYALSFEEGTPLYKNCRKGDIKEPEEELYINMYGMLVEKLKIAGYEHYEISNFSFPESVQGITHRIGRVKNISDWEPGHILSMVFRAVSIFRMS